MTKQLSQQNTSYSLRMPKSMMTEAKEIASEDGISLNQFICFSLAEKIAAFKAIKYVDERASRADRAAFEKIMANVPKIEPDEEDRIN